MFLTKISATLCVLCVPIFLLSGGLTNRRGDFLDRIFNWSIWAFMFSFGALLISLIWGI
jgi:hypothetical protein